ncbi:MAG: HPr family phosphocarrier protein [Chloroflexi bacterium]|nr:HPr family phosphocarrier protein [Chloroflexota bacterium]
MGEIRRKLVVRAPQGVHARIAVRLAGIVRAAQAQLQVVGSRGTADASSPLALLQLALACGDTVELVAAQDTPQSVLDSIVLLLGSEQQQARHWNANGLVPGVGSGAPWWPSEYIGGELPNLGAAEPEANPDWSLARSRVDEELAVEEEMLHAIGAGDLIELVSAERQLLADERLTADLVLSPAAENAPGAEILADLSQRLFAAMRQVQAEPAAHKGLVLMGYRVLLAHLLGSQARWIRAVITCEGGESSHTAIAARWLGIPMVSGFKPADLEEMAACDNLVVDGQEGTVRDEAVIEPISARSSSALPTLGASATHLGLLANADSSELVKAAIAAGAAGIGLVRSEVFYIGSSSLDEGEQTRQLDGLLAASGKRPVTIRLADLTPGMPYSDEVSKRGLAFILKNPAMLQVQFRALLRASIGHDLQALLPLVRTTQEWRAARSYLREEQRAVESYLSTRVNLPLGISLEVPAMVWCLDEMVAEADFISIGSNDLGALMFAQSRESASTLDGRIGLQPAFWRCMSRIASMAQAGGKPVTVCGVLAGQWPEALLLSGLGIKLSVAVDRLQPIARLLQDWSIEKSRRMIDEALLCSTSAELVQRLRLEGVKIRFEV